MDKAPPIWLAIPGIVLSLLVAELRWDKAVRADGPLAARDELASDLAGRASASEVAAVVQAVTPSQPATRRPPNSEPMPSESGTADPKRPSTFPGAVIQVYRASCLQCHDTDGRGEVGRAVSPKIPDFTHAQWQSSRTDEELSHSILEGKGKAMPRMKEKLGSVDVKHMVAFVRAFRDGKQVVDEEAEEPPTSGQPAGTQNPNSERPPVRAASPLSQEDPKARETQRLFQRSCVACHDADGKGMAMRDNLPTIPDFSVPDWQQRRSDAQLLVSILDGKGTGMPAFRDKVARERVRDLVAHIRRFAPGASPSAESASDDFEVRFNQLFKEFKELDQQIRALSQPAPGNTSAPPANEGRS